MANSCGKFLKEIPVGKYCWKFLWENLVGDCCRKSCGKFLWENLLGNSCRKILREILAGNSCGTRRRERSQFKKGSDWWKLNIWKKVMESQPIRIQFGKIFWENLVGNSDGKIMWEIVAEKSCRKLWWEIVAGNCCRKILRENLVEQGGGEEANLRKAVIGGNLAFGIG